MSKERRNDRRQPTYMRILWAPVHDEFFQFDRVANVSRHGAFVETASIASSGSLIRFEILGAADALVAKGTARVAWVDPARGMGIEFMYRDEGERRKTEAIVERLMVEELGEDLATRLLGRDLEIR